MLRICIKKHFIFPLQRSSNQATRKTIRYNKVPTNNRRRNRITSSSTLLKIDAEANLEDEEEDDEDYEEEDEEDIYERELPPTVDNVEDDLEVVDKNTTIQIGKKQRKSPKTNVKSKELDQQLAEEREMNTFVRVPLKKSRSSSSGSDEMTQRT